MENQNDRRCGKCRMIVTYKNWARHLRSKKHLKNDPDQTIKPKKITSNKPTKHCEKCDKEISRVHCSQHLKTKKHLKNDPNQTIKTTIRTKVRKGKTAFKNRLSTIIIEKTKNFIDMKEFLKSIKRIVFRYIQKQLTQNSVKVNMVAFAEYGRKDEHQEKILRPQIK
jgi:flagellar motility protein MotE (MotC chaperone)